MENKKHLIVLILRILETTSDAANPLTQTAIARLIAEKFPCDRKTVGRNIKFLTEIGYPIVKTAKGFYMDRMLFSGEEISLITDAVRASALPEGSKIDKDELCERLYAALTRYYKTDT